MGVSLWCNNEIPGLRNGSKRVRTPVALLRWERHKPPYPLSYGLNSTTTVLLKRKMDLALNKPRRLICQ